MSASSGHSQSTALPRLDRAVVKLIALGIVVLGFAAAVAAPWYVKPLGIPTVLFGVAVFCYPDPHDHLRLYPRVRGRP